MTSRIFKRTTAATALALSLSGLSIPTALAGDATGALTGATLNEGVTVIGAAELNSHRTQNVSLDYLRKVRAHYYDQNIFFDGAGLQEAVQKAGKSREDYVNLQWSGDMERKAIQRAAEEAYRMATKGKIAHERPNGEPSKTAKVSGVEAWAENICGGPQGITLERCLQGLTYEEEAALKAARGKWDTSNGHLHTVLNPSLSTVGASVLGKAGTVQMYEAPSLQGPVTEDGKQALTFNIPKEEAESTFTLRAPKAVRPGKTFTVTMDNGKGYQLAGKVGADESGVIVPSSTAPHTLTAEREGTTTVHFTTNGGEITKSVEITVDPSAPEPGTGPGAGGSSEGGFGDSNLSIGQIIGIIAGVIGLISTLGGVLGWLGGLFR